MDEFYEWKRNNIFLLPFTECLFALCETKATMRKSMYESDIILVIHIDFTRADFADISSEFVLKFPITFGLH